MKSILSKKEAKEKIENFFKNTKDKIPKDVKKMKRLAMHHHISLNVYKKLYCKKCFSIFNSNNSEIRLKSGFKIIRCMECDKITKWKI